MLAILCALSSAVAFILALGTPDAWLLAWIAPIPILWLAFSSEPTRRIALAAAVAYFVGQLGMLWPYRQAMGPVLALGAVIPALAFMGAVLAARLASRRLPAAAAALVFPALWTGWEVLSATLSPHGSFGAWAYSQLSAPIVVQSASLFGPWVVGFLVALFASSIALGIRRRTSRPLVAAVALVLMNLAFGAWRLGQPERSAVRVAASARDHDDSASPEQVAIAQAAEVRRLASGGVRIVVFEEKAALLAGERRDLVLAPLIAAARETGTTVVAGFDQISPDRRNVAMSIMADGSLGTYTKRHHIPGLESRYTIGGAPGLLGAGQAVAICKDFDFQSTLRHDALAAERDGGIDLMFAPSWDFGADGWLHARMAILRGVEGGYSMVRAAANGLLTVSDSRGRVRASRTSGASHYVSAVADVPLGPGRTLYLRVGDAFGWLAGVAGLLLLGWSVRATGPRRPGAEGVSVTIRSAGATISSALAPPAPARRPS